MKRRDICMKVLTQTVLDLISAGLFYCEMIKIFANMHIVLVKESEAQFVTSSAHLCTWLVSGMTA